MSGTAVASIGNAGRAQAPSQKAVAAQIQRVLTSPELGHSERLRALLSFIVEQTLAGRSACLKAYTIGIEVLGRGQGFDSNVDPIVRIEVGRLRRALERYYLLTGQSDPVLIEIPKGAYAAQFSWHAGAPRSDAETPKARRAPRVPQALAIAGIALGSAVVVGASFALSWHLMTQNATVRSVAMDVPAIRIRPFVGFGDDLQTRSHAAGIVDELFVQLFQSRELIVFGPREAASRDSISPADTLEPRGRTFVLEGGVRSREGRLRVNCRLLDGETLAVVWAQTYDAELGQGDPFSIDTEIAAKLTSAIIQDAGVVVRQAQPGQKRLEGKTPMAKDHGS